MYSCNKSRLEELLYEFSMFGKTSNNGVTRLCFSQEDVQARDYFRKFCEELGLDVVWDDMGNMYAKLDGKKDIPPIVIGSHLDSVEKGGRFDGVLGVLSGLEVVKTLIEHKEELIAPIVVMNFTNEEGARFDPAMMSSGVLANKFDKEKMLYSKDKDGVTFKEALEASGYVGKKSNRLKKALSYLELHIEQGPVLESEQLEIGVVEGVLGMVCYEITITGQSNHAGTTPMKLRKDPFFLATDLITEMRKKLDKIDDALVYTMGRVNETPNIHTVIPNKVVFTLEARHQDPAKIKEVEEVIFSLPEEQAGCSVSFEKLWSRDTVQFDESLCSLIQNACEEYSYTFKRMYSGAGHDAQFIASYIPSAMIFVPSVNGKSHCEEELTSFEDCVKGANVLLRTVLALQRNLSKQESKTM